MATPLIDYQGKYVRSSQGCTASFYRQFVRSSAATTVGQKSEGKACPGKRGNGRRCRGKLHDNILDWEDGLPDADLDLAISHAW